MHYVNGVPLEDGAMPKTTEFLNGNTKYGYPPVQVRSEPGTGAGESEMRASGGRGMGVTERERDCESEGG